MIIPVYTGRGGGRAMAATLPSGVTNPGGRIRADSWESGA